MQILQCDWLPEVPGETKPRRHMALKGSKELYPGLSGVTNMWDNFNQGLKSAGTARLNRDED